MEISTWSIIRFQDRQSPLIEQLIHFHDFTITILTWITTLVLLNMLYINTLKITDLNLIQNQTIEIIWTISPVVILIMIALPSLKALYILDDPFSTNITLKSIGHQWYWSYQYSDFPQIEFDSFMLPFDPYKNNPRLLETDNTLVIPTHAKIRIITTAADVIHSWTVPSLGVKADAIPGRLNQITFITNRPGLIYGQCSEICGANHSFIPIKIEAVPMQTFNTWITSINEYPTPMSTDMVYFTSSM